MPIQHWSDDILVVDLGDDPQLCDELDSLSHTLETAPNVDIVLDFAGVNVLNSSNIARLLKLRKKQLAGNRRLSICACSKQIWGIFLITGLDKLFNFHDDVSTALAAMQITEQ